MSSPVESTEEYKERLGKFVRIANKNAIGKNHPFALTPWALYVQDQASNKEASSLLQKIKAEKND